MKIRPQYHFRHSEQGLLSWRVERLLELAAELETKWVALDNIVELNEPYWYGGDNDSPICKSVAEHAKLILNVDLSYPIILCRQGRVMDGMHRVCRAYIEGHPAIKAVQFEHDVEPDYIGMAPDQLPYD